MYFTGRALDATRTQTSVAEQGQLTDRFTKAVDQLDRTGTDHLQARLGAIYALERLARDSPRDQPTIIEILSAFVRTTAPRPIPAIGTLQSATSCTIQSVTPDIHAVLTVLDRRNTTHDQNSRIDLSNACLIGVNFNGADLHGADLHDADLSSADLHDAKLDGAELHGVDLSSADLSDSDLRSADLRSADLRDAKLDLTDLREADLRGANLRDANLPQADLSRADLHGADLSLAYLGLADLRDADLRDASLRDSDLRGADLGNARHSERTDITDAKTDQHTNGAWW